MATPKKVVGLEKIKSAQAAKKAVSAMGKPGIKAPASKSLKSSNKTANTAAWKGAKVSKPNTKTILKDEKIKAATTALKNWKKKSGSLKDY